jgi:osmotically-inducible protein OsmY
MQVLPRTSLALTVPALLLAAALAANGMHRSDAAPTMTADAVAQPPSDRSITASVRDALHADAVTQKLSIQVETRDAAVTLTGELDEDEQVARAVQVARGVSGVREVVNRLTVTGENQAERSNQG